MVSTFSPNRGYELPGTGDYVDTWGPVVNGNFSTIDSNISSVLSIALSASNVTLNSTQAKNMTFLLTGTLSANVSLIFPAFARFMIVSNLTSGAFAVTVVTSAGGSTGVVVPQNSRVILFSDGTNVFFADDGTGVPTGTIDDFAGAIAPTGWLLCDGSAYSRTVQSRLFAVIGTTFGAGDGTTTFNVPDCKGRSRAGRDDMGGSAAGRITAAGSGINGLLLGASGGAQNITLSQAEMPNHTHTAAVSDPSHAHSSGNLAINFGFQFQSGAAGTPATQTSGSTVAAATGISVTNISTGGSGAHNNMGPTMIFNTIIKA